MTAITRLEVQWAAETADLIPSRSDETWDERVARMNENTRRINATAPKYAADLWGR